MTMQTSALPPSLCRVVIDPMTGGPLALVASGPLAGWLAVPCKCGRCLESWMPLKIATTEDVMWFNTIEKTSRYMPPVPLPMLDVFAVTSVGKVSNKSGIYFIWDKQENGKVVYVGQSIRLWDRVNQNHDKINRGEWASWIDRPLETILLDELYYIWLLRPERNSESKPAKRWRR